MFLKIKFNKSIYNITHMSSLKNIMMNSKRVLCRFDLNVPLDKNLKIVDTTRIDAALPTIRYILDQNPKQLTIMSHLGRPKGEYVENLSLKPIVNYLSQRLEQNISLTDLNENSNSNCSPIVCLENIRFNPGEEKNCEQLNCTLSQFGDVFVNDAFGTSHRKHSSTYGVVRYFDTKALGFLVEKELNALNKIIDSPQKPLVAILGGSKVSDKISTIEHMLKLADKILIGGSISYSFLAAKGFDTGDEKCKFQDVEIAKNLLDLDTENKIVIRKDSVVHPTGNPKFSEFTVRKTKAEDIPVGFTPYDIGPQTVKLFNQHIMSAKTIFANGPMGFFENELFDVGTKSVLKSISNSNSYSVIGGGDSVAAISDDLKGNLSHICTGGGASLEYLSNGRLPGIDAVLECQV
jgi:phosphoglycerate kinase